MPKIVRLKQDSTALLATAEVPVATTALRIQRPPSHRAAAEPPTTKVSAEGPTVPAKRPFAAGTQGPASGPIPEPTDADEGRG
jgi:hypothetical protein